MQSHHSDSTNDARPHQGGLGRRQDFLQQVLESLEDYAVFTTDRQGNITSWNAGAERVLGYSEAEIIGQPTAILFTESDQALGVPAQELSTAAREGQALDERLHRRKDGTLFWGSGKVFPLKGETPGFTKIMRDLSGRRQAQQAIEQLHAQTDRQRQQLHTLFMEAQAPIVILDGPAYVYELVNPAYQRIFPGRELLGKAVLEALPELAGSPILDMLGRVYQTGETFVAQEMPLMLARYQGGPLEEIYWTFTYQARRNQEGAVDGIMVFAHEVTPQVKTRQTVEQLAAQMQQQALAFDTVLTSLQDFIYTFDTDCRFTYANQPLLALLGISLEEIVGKTFHQLPYPAELATTLQTHIAQVVATGAPLIAETAYTNPKGHTGYYEYIFRPVFDASQQVVLVAGSTRDVTQRKQAEEAIQRKNQELLRINVDLDNFIYTASHDLKAPISNIEGLLKALLRTLPPETLASGRAPHITSLMQESVERFKKTIASLTEVVKLQKENSRETILVDLSAVVREVCLDLEPMLGDSGAQLGVDLGDCPAIRFSEKNLRSVVYNLLSNALKYRSPERVPQVMVRCESTPEYSVLSVTDNGLGMEAGRLDQLFTMFKRFHVHVEGSGIGLYMVKKMVENAGGRIEVESQVGSGSTFRVFFRR